MLATITTDTLLTLVPFVVAIAFSLLCLNAGREAAGVTILGAGGLWVICLSVFVLVPHKRAQAAEEVRRNNQLIDTRRGAQAVVRVRKACSPAQADRFVVKTKHFEVDDVVRAADKLVQGCIVDDVR